MALSVRGHHTNALPDALRQVALLALPTLRIHLHERLERVRQTRQVRLRGRNRRQGQRRIPRGKDRQAQAERHPGRGVGGGGGGGRGGGGGGRVRVGGVGGRERQRGGHAEDRWQTKMRRERRRPSAGASYRCSLALPDEAFSQHTDLLPGLDQGDDLLSDMSKTDAWRGVRSGQRNKVKATKCNTYPSLSSRSLGMVISSTRSMRLLADSSSSEIVERFRHCSKECSARNVPSNASSLITG